MYHIPCTCLQFHFALSTVSVQMTTGRKLNFMPRGAYAETGHLLFSGGSKGKTEFSCHRRLVGIRVQSCWKDSWRIGIPNSMLAKIPWTGSPVDYSPWGPKQSDTEHVCISSLCSQPKNIIRCLVNTMSTI